MTSNHTSKDNMIENLKHYDTRFPDGLIWETKGDMGPLLFAGYVVRDKENNQNFRITESGYSMLQRWYALETTKELKQAVIDMNESSTKINNNMLKHTKTMKNLTWAILGLTILNLILVALQIVGAFK